MKMQAHVTHSDGMGMDGMQTECQRWDRLGWDNISKDEVGTGKYIPMTIFRPHSPPACGHCKLCEPW